MVYGSLFVKFETKRLKLSFFKKKKKKLVLFLVFKKNNMRQKVKNKNLNIFFAKKECIGVSMVRPIKSRSDLSYHDTVELALVFVFPVHRLVS